MEETLDEVLLPIYVLKPLLVESLRIHTSIVSFGTCTLQQTTCEKSKLEH